ncbi:FMN-binding protein [Sinomonas atrocyanea]
MRKRAALSASVASLGILAIGWQAGAHALEASQPTAAGTTGTTGTTGTGSTTAGSASGASGTSGGTASGSGTTSQATAGAQAKAQATYAGRPVSTRYGDVQVQITVQNGKITDVTALHLTDAEMRSQMISANAAPILRSEVLQAQSANVQTVSGATITSDAYLQSLQAALDAAHL